MNKNKSFTSFYIKYIIVLAVIAVALLAVVYTVLNNYQKEIEKKENEVIWKHSQKAFEEYVSALDANYWVNLWFEQNPDSYDSEESVNAVLENMLSGEVTYKRAVNYAENSPVYVLEYGGVQLAEVTLTGAGSEWSVVDITLRLKGEMESEITVPKGCTVMCNGKKLEEKFCIEENDDFFISQHKSDLVDPYNLVTWKIAGQLTEPVLEVIPPESMELSDDGNGRPVLIMKDSEASEAIVTQADKFFDMYNKYGLYGYYDTQYNADEAAKLCRKDSQVYSVIYEALDGMDLAPCHSDYTTDKTIEPVMVWADNAVSVDIAFSTETTYMGTEKDYFDGEFRILLIDFGNGYEICGISQQK